MEEGGGVVTYLKVALLVLLILAQFDMFAGSFIDIEWGSGYIQLENGTFGHISQSLRHSFGYTGWSLDTAEINLNPQYTNSLMSGGSQPDFAEVFGVFFTAVTGIVAGAKGTLYAIFLTYVTYFFFAICTGFTYLPQASGIAEEYNLHGVKDGSNSILGNFNTTGSYPMGFPRWDDCSTESNAIRDMYRNITDYPEFEYIYKEWVGYGSDDNDLHLFHWLSKVCWWFQCQSFLCHCHFNWSPESSSSCWKRQNLPLC